MTEPGADDCSIQSCYWLEAPLGQLTSLAQSQSLAHAILLSGPAGVGKARLAMALAQFLLCKTPHGNKACGQCKSCLLRLAGNHPDLRQLRATNGTSIGVDDIRALTEFTQGTAQQAGARVILLADCEKMTEAAANALLKTLEEPPAGCYLLLLSAAPTQLKPTILSRCQQWRIAPLTEPALQAWLQQTTDKTLPDWLGAYSGGAPLRALQLVQSGQLETIIQQFSQLQAYINGELSLPELLKTLEKAENLTSIFGLLVQQQLNNGRVAGQFERQQALIQRYQQWCRDEKQILGQNKALMLSAWLVKLRQLLATAGG
ncbi:DNA polymerase III subunit delta' [Arsukibacterium sp.]|uniref:DNA polymerase III subunit delta' n=1 Tax=Arsukibacterium sp. TaxID=1977258 RepID=UPI002FDACA51